MGTPSETTGAGSHGENVVAFMNVTRTPTEYKRRHPHTPPGALLPPTEAWHYRGQTEYVSPCSCSTVPHPGHLSEKKGDGHFDIFAS